MSDDMQVVLQAIQGMENRINSELHIIREGQEAIKSEIKDFRESQEITNKLLTGDSTGIKNQLRDLKADITMFRRDIRDWTRRTDEKIDVIEDRFGELRNALNN
jgi:predicted  nucleic acid-binding Zn-ribbon protein